MKKRMIFKLMSMVGVALCGIGTVLSGWANDREQDEIIEEKVNEAFAASENKEEVEEL